MAVDRLSVTVPAKLGEALRALAAQRGETVSTLVTEAIAHQIRLAALDDYLLEGERQFGPVPDALLSEAEAELLAARKLGARRKRRRR